MASTAEVIVDKVAGKISQAMDRTIMLSNLPSFFTRNQIRDMFRTYGQIERVMLLYGVVGSYTLCALLVMRKKSCITRMLNKGSFMVEGLKVTVKLYSRELHAKVLTKGIHKLYVEVAEQEDEVKCYNLYKSVEGVFADCNFTEIKLLRVKPKSFSRVVKLRFKENCDYQKALNICYKLGVYNQGLLHVRLQPQPDANL